MFHEKRHPGDPNSEDIEAFLSYLAATMEVAASTQNQAFGALLFLYDRVLHLETSDRINAIRAKQPEGLPVILPQNGVFSIIDVQGNDSMIERVSMRQGALPVNLISLTLPGDFSILLGCIG